MSEFIEIQNSGDLREVIVYNTSQTKFVLQLPVNATVEDLLEAFTEHDGDVSGARIGYNRSGQTLLCKATNREGNVKVHLHDGDSLIPFGEVSTKIFIAVKDQKGGADRAEILSQIKNIINSDGPVAKSFFNSGLRTGLNYTNAPTDVLEQKLQAYSVNRGNSGVQVSVTSKVVTPTDPISGAIKFINTLDAEQVTRLWEAVNQRMEALGLTRRTVSENPREEYEEMIRSWRNQ